MTDADITKNLKWREPTPQLEAELASIARIWGILEALSPQQRRRVLVWLRDAIGDTV